MLMVLLGLRLDMKMMCPVDDGSGNSNSIDDGIGNDVIANADAVVADNSEGSDAIGNKGSDASGNQGSNADGNDGDSGDVNSNDVVIVDASVSANVNADVDGNDDMGVDDNRHGNDSSAEVVNGARDDSNNADDVVARGQLISSSGELSCNNNDCV